MKSVKVITKTHKQISIEKDFFKLILKDKLKTVINSNKLIQNSITESEWEFAAIAYAWLMVLKFDGYISNKSKKPNRFIFSVAIKIVFGILFDTGEKSITDSRRIIYDIFLLLVCEQNNPISMAIISLRKK